MGGDGGDLAERRTGGEGGVLYFFRTGWGTVLEFLQNGGG